MGGAVDIGSALEAFARGGYASGGSPLSDVDLQSILKSQQQFLNPYAANSPYGQQGKTPGGQGYVPQAALPTTRLITAGNLPQQQKSGLAQAADMGRSIQGSYQMGKGLLVGSAPTKDDPEGAAGLLGGQGKLGGKNVFT